jgi:hypothetical protein
METLIEDGEGRKLTIRTLNMRDQLRLFKALGPELSLNELYLGFATLAASVTAVDGVPLPFPSNEAAIEHAVERLGEAGLEAVALATSSTGPLAVQAQAGN